MSYTPDFYTGNGVTTQFDVSFSYLSTAHVYMAVNGLAATFTWVDANTVQPTVTPAAGKRVAIYRVTSSTPLVDFTGGDVFPAGDLNTAFQQGLFLAQEADYHSRSRTLRLASTDTPLALSALPLIAARAGTAMFFDAVGQLVTGPAASAITASVVSQAAASASAAAASASASATATRAGNVPTPSVPADDGKFMRAKSDGTDDFELFTPTPGADLLGAVSSTDRAVPMFAGVSGKQLKDGPALGTNKHAMRSNGAGADPTVSGVVEAAFAVNIVGLAKRKREGTATHLLYSSGALTDSYFGAPPAVGETNTGSSLGSGGAGIFKQKVGVDFTFRQITVSTSGGSSGSMLSNASLSLTEGTNAVDIVLTNTWRTDLT